MFTPGTAYNYSNTNYILLGLVMEQVTGKTASELFKERLFDPLGLKDTTLPTLDDASIPSVYAHGYMFATAEKAGGPDPALCGVELMPHCDDLKGKAQSVAIAASRLDQPPVLVVQVEEPFQLEPRVGAELVRHRIDIRLCHPVSADSELVPVISCSEQADMTIHRTPDAWWARRPDGVKVQGGSPPAGDRN